MARKLEGVEENWDIVSMNLGNCQGEYHANDLTQAPASASRSFGHSEVKWDQHCWDG
jgi:hypothetical protein